MIPPLIADNSPSGGGEPHGLDPALALEKVLAESGYFPDARAAAQAAVKVLAGREQGFGPIASMTGIHLVQRKEAL